MKQRTFILYFLIITGMALLFGCKKNNTDQGAGGGQASLTSGVYAAGYELDVSGNYVAQVWKDGVATPLKDGFKTTTAHCVFVTDSDVYVAGDAYTGSGYVATLWKNGVVTELLNTGTSSTATSVYVSGKFVYVSGTVFKGTMGIPALWYNGDLQVQNSGTNGSILNAMTVSGTDIYTAGIAFTNPYAGYFEQNKRTATLWKNGIAITLSSGYNADVNAVAVSGNDVYAAGVVYMNPPTTFSAGTGTAVLWKNGTVTQLDPTVPLNGGYTLTASVAHSIYVTPADVYVAGQLYKNGPYSMATVWKNGMPINLTDGKDAATANAVYVSGNDVYVSGNMKSTSSPSTYAATIWKNGVAIQLSGVPRKSDASSIFIKK